MTTRFIRFTLICALSLVLASTIACRSRSRRTTPPRTEPATTTASDTAPDVATTVEGPEDDFVREQPEPQVASEDLTGDIEVINERAQSRGWIRDAFFDYAAASLSPDAQDALATSASWLKAHPEYNLLIEGHCDERGTEQYNLALGDRRANIAKDYLTTLGVDARRIRTVSFGEERPFDEGSNESAWAKNRRAHLVLTRR